MKYQVVVFGVKDTTERIIDYIENNVCKVDLIITIQEDVVKRNKVSGYMGLSEVAEKYQIPIYEAASYSLDDEETVKFINSNEFDIGISMGWQRLVPQYILTAFKYGVFGFHGNCGYLPYGRGRSPLNWTIIEGDTRFNLNLFQYDENADSPNIFGTEMFSINPHDDIRTAQYKNMICSKRLIAKLIRAYKENNIQIRRESKDFDSWFHKRTPEDGKINFRDKTRNIYNLVRGVTAPFPGAFAYVNENRVNIWEVRPFDEMMDFSEYRPGEVIDIYDEKLIVRTVDGSILINRYTSDCAINIGDIFE